MYTTTTPRSVLNGSVHSQFVDGGFNGSYDESGLIGWFDVKSGTKVDNYQDKIAKKQDASSAYSLDVIAPKIIPREVSLEYRLHNVPGVPFVETFQGLWRPNVSVNHVLEYSDEEKARARSKLFSKLSTASFDSMSFLAELPETVRMLRSPLKALRLVLNGHFDRLLNHRSKIARTSRPELRRRQWQDAVTGTYLETMFGMIPLKSDIDGIVKLIKDYQLRKWPASRQTSRNTFTKRVDYNAPAAQSLHLPLILYATGVSGWTETTMNVQYSVGLDITQLVRQEAVERAMELASFDLRSFVPAIYQVFPYSWAIDYFSSVGNIIEAGSYDQSRVKWVNETVTQITTAFRRVDAPSLSQMKSTVNTSDRTLISYQGSSFGESFVTRTTVKRQPLPELPSIPLVRWHPPENSLKWLNLAMVGAQLTSHQDLSWLTRRGP